MHNAGFAAAAWLDEITGGQNDAASPAEHDRSLRVFDGCLDDDTGILGKIVPPGSTREFELRGIVIILYIPYRFVA